MVGNPYQQYTQIRINTASSEELVVMLYDGAVKFCNKAKVAIDNKNMEMANNNLNKVQAIMDELILGLNHELGGQIADNLLRIYDYLKRRTIEANTKKSIEIIDEIITLVRDLRETWVEAMKLAKKKDLREANEG